MYEEFGGGKAGFGGDGYRWPYEGEGVGAKAAGGGGKGFVVGGGVVLDEEGRI